MELEERIPLIKLKWIATLTIEDFEKKCITKKTKKSDIQTMFEMLKNHKINDDIKIKYVDINEIISAFDKESVALDENIRNNKNGDIFETFLCNWQK